MKVEQLYTGCLAHGAYYIQSEGEAAIIDPLREVYPYLDKARKECAHIKYVFETHFHADFVSGHLDLANKVGSIIVYGPTATPKFKAHIAKDGEEFQIGNLTIQLIHTPGHTLESSCYLLKDQNHKPIALFSGDTLFLGDVGRPDLAQKATNMTQEELAGMLYDSLRNKIMILPDDILVYPAHGAGSACGKHMMKETVDTLGNQKKVNYALRADMTRVQFVKEVTFGLLPPPHYFPENVRMNKEGYSSFEVVLERSLRALTPAEFEAVANDTGAVIIDTRTAQKFAKGFIPNSINIGLDGTFAPWVGALIPGTTHPILLVAEPGKESEAVTRLTRVGYDNTLGYLKGGFESWETPRQQIDKLETISAQSLYERMRKNPVFLIDVRKPNEFDSGHVVGAQNIPLEYLNEHLAEIPKERYAYLYCGSGYRSMIAASILAARGWNNLIEVAGGYKAITGTDIPRTDSLTNSLIGTSYN
jgi:glyoxylase-like metal-dependent hydrolase (beta-lactamase superfamily II)/rhodanese-related sulfurtransferase